MTDNPKGDGVDVTSVDVGSSKPKVSSKKVKKKVNEKAHEFNHLVDARDALLDSMSLELDEHKVAQERLVGEHEQLVRDAEVLRKRIQNHMTQNLHLTGQEEGMRRMANELFAALDLPLLGDEDEQDNGGFGMHGESDAL